MHMKNIRENNGLYLLYGFLLTGTYETKISKG